MFMKKSNKKRGFTITELVVVIAVIAILSAVLIPTFSGVIAKSKLSADKKAVQTLNTAINDFDDDVDTVEDLVEYLDEEHDIDLSSYVPMSKGHSFVWLPTEDKIALYNNATEKIVYPSAYADKGLAVVFFDFDEGVLTTDNALILAGQGGEVVVDKDLVLPTFVPVTSNLTVKLNANISIPTDKAGMGVFYVSAGSTLTLEGTGTVNGVGDNDWSMAIWADGGNVVINGGYYTNVGAGNADHYDLLYVKYGGQITINGGSFKCQTPKWTLNSSDSAPGKIIVAGGEFYEFNPAIAGDKNGANYVGKDEVVIAEGYTVESEVRADGTWYKVVKA